MDKKMQLSKKEIKFLRGLPKQLKFAKRGLVIIALLCVVIFVQNLYYAEHIGRIAEMGGIDSILRSWFNGFDKYKTYTYLHFWVMDRITSSFISFGFLMVTINAIFYRNLIIALDNATVKQKYQENTQEHPILSQYKAILSNAIMRGANPTDAKASFEFVAACLDPNTPSHLLSLHQIARETFKYFHQVEPQDQARLEEIADQVDRVLRERGYREDILTYQEHTLLGSTVWIKYAEQPHTPIGIVTGKLSVDEANKARQLSKIHSAFGHFFGASENLVPISLELLDANGITMRDPQLLNKNLEYVTAKQSNDFPFKSV